MTPLLTSAYWFNLQPPPVSRLMLFVLLPGFAAILAAAIVIRVMIGRKAGDMFWEKGAVRFYRIGAWMGAIGLILLGLEFEQVYFFSARFWLLGWGIIFLAWLAFAVKYIARVVPKQAAEYAERARIEKYLPKRK